MKDFVTGTPVRDFNVNVGTSIPNTIFEEIEAIAALECQGRAHVLRQLLLRGLAAYREDNLLQEQKNSTVWTSRSSASRRNGEPFPVE
jgi:metal-responsive CopG/Arc/MetJ family transcriptional regulator